MTKKNEPTASRPIFQLKTMTNHRIKYEYTTYEDSLTLAVSPWVFVRVSFLQNLKKSPGNLSLTEGPIALNIRFTTQPSDLSDCVFLHNRTTPLGPNDLTSLP